MSSCSYQRSQADDQLLVSYSLMKTCYYSSDRCPSAVADCPEDVMNVDVDVS